MAGGDCPGFSISQGGTKISGAFRPPLPPLIWEGSWPCGQWSAMKRDPGSTPESSRYISIYWVNLSSDFWRCSTHPHVIPLLACKRTLSFCEGAGDGLG